MLSGLKSIDINQINKTQYLPIFRNKIFYYKKCQFTIILKKKIEKGTFLKLYRENIKS